MQTIITLQGDYTAFSTYYQIKFPLDIEIMILANDPIRLLSAFVEGMDLSDLYKTYSSIRKSAMCYSFKGEYYRLKHPDRLT